MDAPLNLDSLSHADKDALIMRLLSHIAAQDERILKLEAHIIQQETRIKELERRLNLNSDNSSKPPSSDGFGKKLRTHTLREASGKVSGGQFGSKGTNLKQSEKPALIIDHMPKTCIKCGTKLDISHAKRFEKRQVFDIPPPKPVEMTEHRAHVCKCPKCGEKTKGVFPANVKAQAQYGANIANIAVYLQAFHLVPEDRLAELLSDLYDLNLSTATIASFSSRKADEWQDVTDFIEQSIKKAPVKHLDETGIRVEKKLAWLHVAILD